MAGEWLAERAAGELAVRHARAVRPEHAPVLRTARGELRLQLAEAEAGGSECEQTEALGAGQIGGTSTDLSQQHDRRVRRCRRQEGEDAGEVRVGYEVAVSQQPDQFVVPGGCGVLTGVGAQVRRRAAPADGVGESAKAGKDRPLVSRR